MIGEASAVSRTADPPSLITTSPDDICDGTFVQRQSICHLTDREIMFLLGSGLLYYPIQAGSPTSRTTFLLLVISLML